MRLLLTGLAALLVSPVVAEDFATNSPQVITKTYTAMHQIEAKYDLGKSTFTLTSDCHVDQRQKKAKLIAQEAIDAKVAAIKTLIDAKATQLGLGAPNEKWGHKLDAETKFQPLDPIQTSVFSEEKKQLVFKNRCTGEESLVPVRAAKVLKATKVITVWFPNDGKVLNDLNKLVNEIEKTSDGTNNTGVNVVCNSKGGANFDLEVAPSKRKALLAKIEEIARERAEAKADADMDANDYDQVWPISIKKPFQENGFSKLPILRANNVKKVDGKWQATFKDSEDFNVYYRQSSEASTKAGKLAGMNIYRVNTEETVSEGLYATLSIGITQRCFDKKDKAEEAVGTLGAIITGDEKEPAEGTLRFINNGRNVTSDRLKFRDASAQRDFDVVGNFNQYKNVGQKNQETYQVFYNKCDLSVFKDAKKAPAVESYKGTQYLTISSSNIDALVALKKDLEKRYPKSDDIRKTQVTANISYNATLDVLEAVGAQLSADAVRKFKARGGDFQCDLANFSFACLAPKYVTRDIQPEMRESLLAKGVRSQAAAFDGNQNYSQGPREDISAEERGMAVIKGSYTVKIRARKVLHNDER